MKTKGSKSLKDKITEATQGINCPIHRKEALITVDTKEADVKIEGCCTSFKMDIKVIVDRVIRAWNLNGEHLRAKKNENYRKD